MLEFIRLLSNLIKIFLWIEKVYNRNEIKKETDQERVAIDEAEHVETEAKVIKCYNCGGMNRVIDEDSTCEYCDSHLASMSRVKVSNG